MLSGTSQAIIIDALSECGHTELNQIFRAQEVRDLDAGGNLTQRPSSVVDAIIDTDPENADHRIIALAGEMLERGWKAWSKNHRAEAFLERTEELRETLRVEGWEFVDGRLIPTDPAPVELAPEVTTLELRLAELGFDVAQTHYRQAVDNYADGNSEACGSQVRSFLEELFRNLCQQHGKDLKGKAALQHLYHQKLLEKDEFDLARALFDCVQSRGAHAGLSDDEEARFRVHCATTVARYLISRLSSDD